MTPPTHAPSGISNKTIKGIVFILLSAFLYSIMPILIRTLGSNGLPPISQVFLRYIAAFAAAAVYFFAKRSNKISILRTDIPLLLIASIFGYALTNLFFTYAVLNTLIGNALFLFFSFAIIAPILGFIFLRDKVNKYNIISLILIFIALLLLFQPNAIPTWKIGGFFAILSAFGQASYVVIRRKLVHYPAYFMMLANTLMGVIVLGILSFTLELEFYQTAIQQVTDKTWITTVLFGIDNFFAWLAMTKGFEYLSATTGSIMLLSELVFSITLAFLLFGELPAYITIAGGILIVASSILVITKGKN